MPDENPPRTTDKKLLYGRLVTALVCAIAALVTSLMGFQTPGYFICAALFGITSTLIVHMALESGRVSTDSDVRGICRRLTRL